MQISTGGSRNESYPTWLEELVGGPLSKATSSPMYCTRGYVFQKRPALSNRKTVNFGVIVTTDSLDYYGEIKDILEIEYPGIINLKCVLFRCDWYDPHVPRGVRLTKYGVIEVNSRRRLRKYDPFILASQAGQVCYIPYPRVSNVADPWITVTQINPRGRVDGMKELEPLQQTEVTHLTQVEAVSTTIHLVDEQNAQDAQAEDILENIDDSESEDEYHESTDSASSEYSSDSE